MKKELIIALLLTWIISVCFAEDSRPNNFDFNHASASEVKSVFMTRLLQVANTGNLFEPSTVANILGFEFESNTKELVPQPADCEKWLFKSFKETTSKLSGDNWFHSLPSAEYLMVVPRFEYKIEHTVSCPDTPRLQFPFPVSTEAHLRFDGLFAFSCISSTDIKDYLSKAQFASDNPEDNTRKPYSHSSDMIANDAYGTRIIFDFHEGGACADGVTILQSQTLGWRYNRADHKYQSCKDRVDSDYCEKHPSTWRNNWQEMRANSEKTCGKFYSYYQNESPSGEPSSPLSQHATCEGFK
jgi:hypothetical protein